MKKINIGDIVYVGGCKYMDEHIPRIVQKTKFTHTGRQLVYVHNDYDTMTCISNENCFPPYGKHVPKLVCKKCNGSGDMGFTVSMRCNICSGAGVAN